MSSHKSNLPALCAALFLAATILHTNGVLSADGPAHFNRGDANSDGSRDISDPIFTLNYLFLGGRAPTCRDSADTNDDGSIDMSDAVMLLWFLFQGAASPAEPNGFCGPDMTDDDLGCEVYEACPLVDFSNFLIDRFAETADNNESTVLDGLVFCFSDDEALFDSILLP